MDRRDLLKASLAGAAAMGISSAGAAEAQGAASNPPINPPKPGLDPPQRTSSPGTPVDGAPDSVEVLASLGDYEAAAKRKLSAPAWEYFNGGSGDEITLRRNRTALDGLQLKPRVLVDTSHIDTSCTLLGFRLEHPILLAPTSSHVLAHPDAEVATARGAAEAKTILIASTTSNRSIEEICKAATGPVWFQLYVEDDRAACQRLIERAEAAGAKALVITVDNALAYARNREERMKGQAPMLAFPNIGIESAPGGRGLSRRRFNWSELGWIQGIAKTPVILKGILNPDDADRAAQSGVAAIVVSNHGGRVLDTEPATIEVLPAVVDRVAGRVPVLFDGGVRRGTDVLKGLGYGAAAVLIGRPYIYGLAVHGPEGIRDVVGILRTELEGAMAMTGRVRLADVDRGIFWKSADYSS
jgi:4-hydroxymandelate oxidase